MDTEKLLNEAGLLNTRINEIYSVSFELKKDLLKQGYYDALLEDIFSRAYKVKKRIELVISNLSSPIEVDTTNQFEQNNTNNYEKSSINIEDIYRIAENLGAEIKDVIFYAAKPAKYSPIPKNLYPSIKERIQLSYPKGLYSHQAKAIELGLAGNNVCVATPTASGKTLIFTSIAISHLLANEGTVIIALYPAKALLHDQKRKWQEAIDNTSLKLAIIDGGVEVAERIMLLQQAQIILMTPDVLHAWLMLKLDQKEIQLFLAMLAMVILDEAHIYNGIFGTNMAYLLRRLRAVSGVNQFLASSATIGDPIGFLEQLTGIQVNLIGKEDDGAAVPKKEIMLLRIAISQTTKFLKELIQEYISNPDKQGRFLIFVDSRKRVEELAAEQNTHTNIETNETDDILEKLKQPMILPYRAGYEKEDREKIQQALTHGGLSGVITTSALELGIDIGDIELVIMLGEPSSIKSFWQRAGRAGRSKQGLIVLLDLDGRVTAMGLEKYLSRPPEPNWVYLDNEYLQYANVLCAADEQQKTQKSIYSKTSFETLPEAFLELLDNEIEPTRPISQELYPLKQQINTKNPHYIFPLRNGIEKSYQVICHQLPPHNQQLGTLTYTQLLREAFPGAIYRYMTKPYRVEKIEHPNGRVIVSKMKQGIGKTTPTVQTMVFPQFNDSMYFIRKSEIAFITECRVQVSERVTGFTERWGANQKEHIYEPKNEYAQKPLINLFYTTAVCFYFPDIQNILNNLARYIYLAFCKVCSIQENDIGSSIFTSQISPLNSSPIKGFAIYDSVMGSLRLTKQILQHLDEVLTEAIRIANEESQLQCTIAIEEIVEQIKLFGQKQEDIVITELFAPEKEDDWKIVIAANQLALYHDGQNHINEQVTVLRYVYTPNGIKYFLKPKTADASWQVKYEVIRPIPEITKLERYNVNTGDINTI
jgi:DEAD/DEAH box helicase domain-containing protein